MKLYQRMLENLQLKACEVIDFTVLPAYRARRDALFGSMGVHDIRADTDLVDPEVVEIALDSDPLTQALDALNENISGTVWVKRDSDPFNNSEFIIGGMAVQRGENKVSQFVVFLRDRFSEAQQPVPLYVLLESFQPLEHLKPQDYHS